MWHIQYNDKKWCSASSSIKCDGRSVWWSAYVGFYGEGHKKHVGADGFFSNCISIATPPTTFVLRSWAYFLKKILTGRWRKLGRKETMILTSFYNSSGSVRITMSPSTGMWMQIQKLGCWKTYSGAMQARWLSTETLKMSLHLTRHTKQTASTCH